MSYFKLQERQRVENTAKDIITYLRDIENKARTGDRGTGNCHPSNTAKAVSNKNGLQLKNWETTINNLSIDSKPHCLPGNATASTSDTVGNSVSFTPNTSTNNLQLRCTGSSNCKVTIQFEPLFGNTLVNGSKNQKFILYDTVNNYCYTFQIKNGAITSGKLFNTLTECQNADVWKNLQLYQSLKS